MFHAIELCFHCFTMLLNLWTWLVIEDGCVLGLVAFSDLWTNPLYCNPFNVSFFFVLYYFSKFFLDILDCGISEICINFCYLLFCIWQAASEISFQIYIFFIIIVQNLLLYRKCSTIVGWPDDHWSKRGNVGSIAVGQAVACTPVMQLAWVRSPVGTNFLGEVFWGFSSPVRQMSGSFRPPRFPNIIGHHYNHQSSFITGAKDPMLTHPKTSNIQGVKK